MHSKPQREDGFTLIEVMVTILLMSLLMAIAAGPWSSFQQARAHKETARLVVSAMRNAQVSAVAESTRYRVAVTDAGRSVTVYQSPVSGTEVKRSSFPVADSRIEIAGAAFVSTAGTSTSAFFYGRGSATPGELVIRRQDHPDIKIKVEGLTGRVSIVE